MAHSKSDKLEQAGRILEQLAADKKRTGFAIALLAVMAFMWFRVLTGEKPGSVEAATGAPDAQTAPAKPPQKISYLSLPVIPGRNDYINRDFFAAWDWECFRQNSRTTPSGPGTEVRAASANHAQEVIAKLAQKLKLEAVLKSGDPQAFINDQLYRVGDRLTVRDGPDTCEFEVLQVHEDSVLVRCNETQLTLKLMQHLDVKN
jgi:hypothetical protein